MAMTPTLRARLEVMGGKELVQLFDRIGTDAKKAFDKIDREAAQATREVKKLEKELKDLDRVARDIRAKIKIDKTSGPTAEQARALAFADDIERQSAAIRKQIQTFDDVMALNKGDGLRAFAQQSDKDLLSVQDATRKIGGLIDDIRAKGGVGDLISDEQLDRINTITDRLKVGNTDALGGLNDRVQAVDDAAIKAAQVEADRATKKAEAATKAAASAEKAQREKDERIAAAQKRREEDRAAYGDKIAELSKKFSEEAAQQRGENRDNIKRLREDFLAREGTLRQSLIEERAEWRAQSQEQERLFKQASDAQELKYKERLAKERASNQIANQKADAQFRKSLADQKNQYGRYLSEMRAQHKAQIEKIDATHGSAIARHEEAVRRLRAQLSGVKGSFDGASKSAHGFHASSGIVSSAATRIGKTFATAARDIGKFGTALRQLEYAVGNTALRAGIGALLGVLGAGLAALGGAAALGGIAAIAGLAAFNAVDLQNAADAVGQSLDVFTALKYASGAKGIGFDDYTASLQSLRETMAGIVSGNEDFAAAGELFKKFRIPLLSSDGKNLADARVVLGQIADVLQTMPNKNIQVEFLTKIGSDKDNEGLSKLFPMLQGGSDEINKAAQRAIDLGVVLTSAQMQQFKALRAEFWDLWQIVVGLSYKLSAEVMPKLMPVLEAIEKWLMDHQDLITGTLVKAFDYLIQVVKDFWKLWNEGSNADVTIKWTATFWYASEQIVKALMNVWDGIKRGYAIAEPWLAKLADFLGMSGPLEAALTILAGQLLGVSNLFLSLAGVGVAAVRIVANALLGTLWPIIGRVLGGVGGIIGWPVLLAAGIGVVIAYWDDIEGLFTAAWAKFKETFPKTAEYLETTFGTALSVVKSFVGSTLDEFKAKFPQIPKFIDDVKASANNLWQALQNFDWGPLLDLGKTTGAYLLENLIKSIQTLTPLLDYLVTNTLNSLAMILTKISGAIQEIKGWGMASGALDAESAMTPEQYSALSNMLGAGNTEFGKKFGADALRQQMLAYQGRALSNPSEYDRIGAMLSQMQSRIPQSPVSSATALPGGAAMPPLQTPVVMNFPGGETVIAISPQDGLPEMLAKYTTTQAATTPSWRR